MRDGAYNSTDSSALGLCPGIKGCLLSLTKRHVRNSAGMDCTDGSEYNKSNKCHVHLIAQNLN